MTGDEVVAKCRDLMAPVLGAAGAGRLIDRVLTLEKSKDIRELRPLLHFAHALSWLRGRPAPAP